MEFFEVGGCVRDEIMGVKSNDIDFVCVLDPSQFSQFQSPFVTMQKELIRRGFKIWLSKPEFLTIRARFPETLRPGMLHFEHKGMTADFVLARKDGVSTDGRRPDFVTPGTLIDDLSRRDFTMNAIAKDADGKIIDPFGGTCDIADRMIRCVGSAEDRFREDALRGLRALRFMITKGFRLDKDIRATLAEPWFADLLSSVSKERQREEMEKMFAHDTLATLRILSDDSLRRVNAAIFSDGLRLSATMKG